MLHTDLMATRSSLESAFGTGDVDLLNSLLAEHVVWATSSQPPWLGRQQVLDRVAGFFEQHQYVLRFGPSQVDSDGTRAVERTNFESWVDTTPDSSGEPHRGSVVIIWKREADWRIGAYVDLGTVLFPPSGHGEPATGPGP